MDPTDSRIRNINFSLLLFLGIIIWSCNGQKSSENMSSNITKSEFGSLENGETVYLFTLKNSFSNILSPSQTNSTKTTTYM